MALAILKLLSCVSIPVAWLGYPAMRFIHGMGCLYSHE